MPLIQDQVATVHDGGGQQCTTAPISEPATGVRAE